jgi:hypothetical protein
VELAQLLETSGTEDAPTMRHATVSLWLNAWVPPTQVAEWAVHSVNVPTGLHQVIDGRQARARDRIQASLASTGTSARIPHVQP